MNRALVLAILVACGDDASTTVPDSGACTADPIAPGGACPSACTRCDGTTCVIECGAGACSDRTLTCPTDLDCAIACTGLDSCDTTIVLCPPGYGCTMSCTAYDACGDVTLRCGAGPCGMTCNGPTESCGGARIDCAPGAKCGATCNGSTGPALDCAGACECTPC